MGWRTKNLTTATAGAPHAVYQPTAWLFAQFTRHVVFQGYNATTGGDGQLYELYCSASDDWHVNNLVDDGDGVPVWTTANGYIWAHQGSQHVVYQGRLFDGHVHELWYTEDDGWNAHDLTNAAHAPLALSQPYGYETSYDGTQRVVYQAQGPGGHIHELSNSGHGWHDLDLTAATGAPPTAPGATPTGYSFESQRTAHVLARTELGHILEFWADASGWHWGDLTTATRAPVAGDSDRVNGYVFRGEGTQHVDYVGGDGHLHELWWRSSDGWHHNDLTFAAAASVPAPGSSPAGYAFESGLFQPVATQHVLFTGHDGMVHELWWSSGAWHVNDIAARVGAPPIVGDPVAFVEVDNGSQNVFYLSDAHEIIELRWTP
jgi:hypothetical protein